MPTSTEPLGPTGPVTLDHVARLSGVSRATASRALNGRAGVRPEVRDRVERIAESLGFVPNRAARNLASGRSSVIGLLLPSSALADDPYGASIVQAVGGAADRAGQGLMLHLAPEVPPRSLQHVIGDGLVAGLVISATLSGVRWVEDLIDGSLPTVLIGRHPERLDVDSVSVENVESSAAAVTHLFDTGCRRVAIITGRSDRVDSRERLEGYRLAHRRAGRPIDNALVVAGHFTRSSGKDGAARLLGRGIDGLFTSNDTMAAGALWMFARAGVRVPADISVVGFDGAFVGDLVEPKLTTMRQPFDEIGRAAVERLLARIDGGGRSGPILIPPVFEPGDSSRPPVGEH